MSSEPVSCCVLRDRGFDKPLLLHDCLDFRACNNIDNIAGLQVFPLDVLSELQLYFSCDILIFKGCPLHLAKAMERELSKLKICQDPLSDVLCVANPMPLSLRSDQGHILPSIFQLRIEENVEGANHGHNTCAEQDIDFFVLGHHLKPLPSSMKHAVVAKNVQHVVKISLRCVYDFPRKLTSELLQQSPCRACQQLLCRFAFTSEARFFRFVSFVTRCFLLLFINDGVFFLCLH
jgi:hypothetical protein